MLKETYSTENERAVIIDKQTKKGLLLVKEENITKGNFLFFVEPKKTEPTEIELLRLEQAQANAELFQLVLMLTGGNQ